MTEKQEKFFNAATNLASMMDHVMNDICSDAEVGDFLTNNADEIDENIDIILDYRA